MKINKIFTAVFLSVLFINTGYSQNIKVDVNLNIKHSVEGVSDFGRERHMTVHSTPTEVDWVGEEDKLNYLINDLDVYFGRDNGSATWKFQDTPEDPDRTSKPDVDEMQNRANYLKNLYDQKYLAHQYENKGAMIMGINPHPIYPTLNWYERGRTWHGWQPWELDTSVEWIVEYLDKYFEKNEGESGEPLPTYWEVINEPDMEMMTGAMMCTSQEKLWEFHNLVAYGVRARLGDKAPKIGGMTWGQHDFHLQDGINRVPDDRYDQWLTPESLPVYHNMIDSQVNATRGDNWYQWDVMWQGFIDTCGDNMDFYGVHLYDWPQSSRDKGALRTGGQVEATLDMLEWYDNYKFGQKKDIVISEFGAVSGWLDEVSAKRRAWENLRPFNSMFMQFLERPSHLVLTMPFAPVKAEWGDVRDEDGNLIKRYPSTLLDEDENGNWQWTDFVLFYELWKDVDGTRIDTKANNLDILVDAYVKNNHVYLILNNLKFEEQTLDLHLFDDYTNKVQGVKMNHLFFDESKGTFGESVMDERTFTTAPGAIKIAGDGTIVLDYTFENPVTIDQTSEEKKFMSEILEDGTTAIGGVKFRKRVEPNETLTTHINNVVVPSGAGEVTLRIAGRFWESGMQPKEITFNGHSLPLTTDWRGETRDSRNVWFGVYELDVPIEYLETNNTVTCTAKGNYAEYTTVMIQVFDFSKEPKRSDKIASVAVTSLAIDEASLDLMVDENKALNAHVVPENATNTAVTWSSSNEGVATVDEFGIVTGVSEGTVTITATSVDGSFTDSATVNVSAFSATAVSSISINEGDTMSIEYYKTTPLQVNINPINATEQNVSWSSSDTSIVEVDSNTGKVVGKVIYGTATITATLTDPNNGGMVHSASTLITVDPPADFVSVTGVSITPDEKTLTAIGEKVQLTEVVLPSNATIKTHTWSSSDTNVATVTENGLVTAVANGTAQITVVTTDGDFSASCNLIVEISTDTGNKIVIEAEEFNTTGGTFDDGYVAAPYGVNKGSTAINYVNSGDWVTYENVNVEDAAEYNIVYFISTPVANAQVQISVDGNIVSTDNVTNTGGWDSYGALTASQSIELTSGMHTVKVVASGSNAWQWNLDKIEFQQKTLSTKAFKKTVSSAYIYPNPVVNSLTINGENSQEAFVVRILTPQGSLLKVLKIDGIPSTIDVSDLDTGVYLLNVGNTTVNKTLKMVKTK
ncbi:hypothetical protein AXE80_01610 [Wenyingzhuangia fucanilytica]|uniref:CBM6 domain-containing protein n=1 Tax=Wenyingzhuangia fucanilytica TaxID=1790137 RepID=A0A1B1Y2U2_9FLAO|nr:Ig-like domain-containing protein [Wenyingzhuangia fucanilytica]ANW95070.1 hypothetical protein AXE80_01610 [Wenyingzhuangia fucanilytica]